MSFAKRAALFFAVFLLATISLSAQDPQFDTSSPGAFLGNGNLSLLEYGLTILVSFLTAFIPGLSKVNGYLRTIASGLLVLGVFAIFKKDALQITTFQFIYENIFPLLLTSVGGWEFIRNIFKFFGINIKPKALSGGETSAKTQ
jgi:hypothetical protein